jgi:DNA-binding Xre family transcriptional regulator
MFSYNKLWKLLIDRGYKKTDLLEIAGLHPTTLAKMGKGADITTKVIGRLCEALRVQPGDIMEYEFQDEKKDDIDK